jgi:hypothetical protein
MKVLAQILLGLIQDLKMCDDPESAQHRAAAWFLFESHKAFFFACSEANVRYSLEPNEAWLCGGRGSRDLTAFAEGVNK